MHNLGRCSPLYLDVLRDIVKPLHIKIGFPQHTLCLNNLPLSHVRFPYTPARTPARRHARILPSFVCFLPLFQYKAPTQKGSQQVDTYNRPKNLPSEEAENETEYVALDVTLQNKAEQETYATFEPGG